MRAQEASSYGLLTQLVDDDEQVLPAAQELAARLAAGPTVAYGGDQAGAVHRHARASLSDALAAEAQAQAICGATADHQAAVAASWPSRSRSSRAADGFAAPTL